MTGLTSTFHTDSRKSKTQNALQSGYGAWLAGLLTIVVMSSPVMADGTLNPELPAQFDKEAFTRELNRESGVGKPQNAEVSRKTVDSYGSRRFVDLVEIRPVAGPRYFLLDDDGNGTPNIGGERAEGDLSERRSISKWRLGKW